ncbi:molybdopterin oxidoreductase family protein [Candidatus Alkanophaga liquidiphilum]
MPIEKIKTVCPMCALGCGLLLVKEREVVGLDYWKEHPFNEGALCPQGNLVHEIIHHERRLTTPLVREGDSYKKASWGEALGIVASRIKTATKEFGGDAVVFLSSGFCTNEENYLIMKLAAALHVRAATPPSAASGLKDIFGYDASITPLTEVKDADHLFIVGEPIEQNPLAARYMLKAKFDSSAWVTAVGTRPGKTAWFSNLFLQCKPGGVAALLLGIIKSIVESEAYDKEFVEKQTKGFDELKSLLDEKSPQEISEMAGVSPTLIAQAASTLAKASKPCIIYTTAIFEENAREIVKALADLVLLLNATKVGLCVVEGVPNIQGAKDVLEEEFNGNAKVVVALGGMPPYVNLDGVEFIATTQTFLRGDEKADVILPGACFAEKEGTFTSTDRFIQRLRKAVEPPRGARAEAEILAELAARLGVELGFEGWPEVAAAVKAYGGIVEDALEGGVRWGGKRLYESGFETTDRFARLLPFDVRFELPRPEGKFLVITERRTFNPEWALVAERFWEVTGKPWRWIEINPEDAATLGLSDGDAARLKTDAEELVAPVVVRREIPKNILFASDYKTCVASLERV